MGSIRGFKEVRKGFIGKLLEFLKGLGFALRLGFLIALFVNLLNTAAEFGPMIQGVLLKR